ncbi:MAG: hypothetical protein AB7U98_13500 [Candidatus Nitrosocosmicus sp.]
MFVDPLTGESRGGVMKVKYSHDAMIDTLIAKPHVTQGELAAIFGYSQGWVSQIINSDAFKARLAERKGELVDPLITASVDERLRSIAQRSLDKVLESLDSPMVKPEHALATARFATEALGYGARPKDGGGGQGGVAVIVNVPGQAPSADAWIAAHRPPGADAPLVQVVEVPTGPPPVDHETAKTYP